MSQAAKSEKLCINCFHLVPYPLDLPSECSNEIADSSELQLLCPSCISHLSQKSESDGRLSPLPKLSLLVKAEAKCQDQLQLLRRQHELLMQQKESLEATKRTKDEALAVERKLARQRRKQFLMMQDRRKVEEELKYQQLQKEDQTSRSEQENCIDKMIKPKVKKTLLRRKTEPGLNQNEGLPKVSKQVEQTINTQASNTEALSTNMLEKRRQVMVCYSQDLSPLIDGRKPKRLPFPKPVKKIQTQDKIESQRLHNRRNNTQQAVKKTSKSPSLKHTKLRPLVEKRVKVQPYPSNQIEDLIPYEKNPSTPLTAEIKHVSWAYELGNDGLSNYKSDTLIDSWPHPIITGNTSPQLSMSPLPSVLHEQRTFPRWEYSAERLSTLLEKYNVSVSSVTSTTAPTRLD